MDDEPTDVLPGDPVPEDGVPDDEEPDEIPVVVMGAMKDRMHARRLSPPDDPSHVEVSLGGSDDDIHVVDDGPDHCMIGRPVGYTPDGCVYVLVGRLTRYGYEQLRDGDTAIADAFSEAGDVSLCAVFEVEGTVQNIALVRHFRRTDDIPADYLPPAPFLEFSDDEFPDDDEVNDDEINDDGESSDSTAAGARPLRRAFFTATAAARRVRRGGRGSGFPPI